MHAVYESENLCFITNFEIKIWKSKKHRFLAVLL